MEGPNPLLSVIIPTHNRVKMLKRAVQSALNQTVRDLEIIIIADDCTDGTREMVSEWQDSRIRYVDTKGNIGGAKARNIGMDMARGEFIAFLDDDDSWDSRKCKRQIEELRRREDVVIVSCNYRILGNDPRKMVRKKFVDLEDTLYINMPDSFSLCMVRAKDVRGVRINEELTSSQDWDLWLKLMIDSGKGCYIVQEFLADYYEHQGPRISDYTPEKIAGYIEFIRSYSGYMTRSMFLYHRHMVVLFYLRVYRLGEVRRFRLVIRCLRLYLMAGHNINKDYILMILGKLRWKGKYDPVPLPDWSDFERPDDNSGTL